MFIINDLYNELVTRHWQFDSSHLKFDTTSSPFLLYIPATASAAVYLFDRRIRVYIYIILYKKKKKKNKEGRKC